MKLSRLQQLNLKLYSKFKDQELSLGKMLWFNRKMYLLFFGFVIPLITLIFYASGAWLAFIFTAFVAGACIRDIGWYRRSIIFWPVVKQITNWDVVAKLQEESENKIEPIGAVNDHPRGAADRT